MTSSNNMIPVLEFLAAHQGQYQGHGTNFEGLPFKAELAIRPFIDGNVIELRFRAVDEEQAFHEEVTWISSDLIENRVALWTVSSNTPGVLRHDLREDLADDVRERRLVFRLGDPEDRRIFRQEITLDLLRDGSIEYRYSWGVPHEALTSRNRTILRLAPGRNPGVEREPR